jgi:hypothetical protein
MSRAGVRVRAMVPGEPVEVPPVSVPVSWPSAIAAVESSEAFASVIVAALVASALRSPSPGVRLASTGRAHSPRRSESNLPASGESVEASPRLAVSVVEFRLSVIVAFSVFSGS